jgi:regulator of replication initiation timing
MTSKSDNLKQRMLASWKDGGNMLVFEALGEILILEEQVEDLRQRANELMARNVKLVIELDALKHGENSDTATSDREYTGKLE